MIQQLSSGSKFVQWRDASLTRLLQDSFSGGAKTTLIAHVIPTLSCAEQTMNTLKFADNVRNIMQRARRYEVSAQDDATINRLQEEINFLKGILLKTQLGAQPIEQFKDHRLSKILDDKKKILARIADNEREKKEILDKSFY